MSCGPRTICMRASSASGSSARNASTRALIASAGAARRMIFMQAIARRRIDDGPCRAIGDFMRLDAGFLQEFARRARREIDAAGEDILRVGRAGGKIDRAGVGRVRGHFAEQEGAVAADERRHREAVADLAAGKAEIPPGEEGGVIGLEIGAAQDLGAVGARLEGVAAEQQHAAVVEARLGGLPRPPMRGDPLRFGLGEGPGPRREPQVEFGDFDECAARSQIDRPFGDQHGRAADRSGLAGRRPPLQGRARSCWGGPSRRLAR